MTAPIDRLATAKAALDAARREYDAALDVIEKVAIETGATQFKGDTITVSVCTRRTPHAADFTAWVAANHPEQIEPTVRAKYRKVFLDGLRWDNGEAYTDDGECVDFVEETRYLSVRSR